MNVEPKTLLYPVSNPEEAKAIFGALFGVEPTTDAPYYVGFHIGDHEIGLVPNGHSQGMTGPVPYFEVQDIKATIDALKEAGAQLQQEPTDVGNGLLVATATDRDGNVIGLRQAQ